MKPITSCFCFLLISLLSVFSGQAQTSGNASRYAPASKLATGKWIKLKVTSDAVYKLSFDDIRRMGISDPSKVKIYGYGGKILDEDFSKPTYIDDLPEIAVWMNKGSDGVFNSGDYILFYGQGTVKWTYDSNAKIFVHQQNPYSTYGAYFITEDAAGPKLMGTQASLPSAGVTYSTYDDYQLHEVDSLTITNTGRELYGESFVSRYTQTFNFNIPGITSDDGTVSLSFIAKTYIGFVPVTLSIGGMEVIRSFMPTVSPTWPYQKGNSVNENAAWTGSKSENVSVGINYPANVGTQTTANLNYIRLNFKRNLRSYGPVTFFRNASSVQKAARYNISGATASQMVLDVTNPLDVKVINASLSGDQLSFTAQSGSEIHEYALVDVNGNFSVPESLGEVKNQNLHGLAQTDMVILVPEAYRAEAERLAVVHRQSGLKVTVVQADQVLNEFSSGVPDATAYRRFMKMFYDRALTENDKPKYLLLFGDGIFDNRFLTPACRNFDKSRFLLTYQFKESLDETYSFGTDDYFGFLDDNEGTNPGGDVLDLGIGRFPVNSLDQAKIAVDKVLAYMLNKQFGPWKNVAAFVSDDTDDSNDTNFCEFGKQADQLAGYMNTNYPSYMLSKSYQDAFKTVNTNGKKTYPDAKSKMMNTLKNGCFLLDYTGHGSTTAWTSEDLLTISDVNQMSFPNLPLWITATCDFGWFDGVNISAGEAAFLNKKSGAIALFTTTRVVYSLNNLQINDKLIRNLYARSNGKYKRLGDVMRDAKKQLGYDTNKLNYALLGDPALTLNFPEYSIELETVNGKAVNQSEPFNFRALDKVELTGKIVDLQGNTDTQFNGIINTTAFDAKQTLSSVQSSNLGNYFTFDDYPNKIFTGSAEVKDGKFTVTFTVPLDISYSDDLGKMNFYASDESKGKDAQGYFLNYRMNGTNPNAGTDSLGPEIKRMYLNDVNFKSGDQVNETPYFVADVFDEDGINVTGGSIGHDISLSIDRKTSWTYNLNAHYEPVSTTLGEGIVKFSVPTLTSGNHTLYFKVWDLSNNSTEDSVTFQVVTGLKPQLFDLVAASNPARENTYFLLNHDRPDSPIEVTIRVYDLTGKSLWTHTEQGSSAWLKSYPIEWDLRTNSGSRLQPGVYVYQAAVSSPGGKETTKAKKIIILGQ